MKVLFLIVLFAASAFGQSIQERVKKFENAKAYTVEYDKSLRKTFVRYATSIKLPLFVYTTIADSGQVEYLLLHATTVQAKYYPMTMQLLLDGEIMELDNIENNGKTDSGVVFPVTAAQLERIGNTKEVELRFSYFEGKLDSKTLTGFRNLVSLAKPPSPVKPK